MPNFDLSASLLFGTRSLSATLLKNTSGIAICNQSMVFACFHADINQNMFQYDGKDHLFHQGHA